MLLSIIIRQPNFVDELFRFNDLNAAKLQKIIFILPVGFKL